VSPPTRVARTLRRPPVAFDDSHAEAILAAPAETLPPVHGKGTNVSEYQ